MWTATAGNFQQMWHDHASSQCGQFMATVDKHKSQEAVQRSVPRFVSSLQPQTTVKPIMRSTPSRYLLGHVHIICSHMPMRTPSTGNSQHMFVYSASKPVIGMQACCISSGQVTKHKITMTAWLHAATQPQHLPKVLVEQSKCKYSKASLKYAHLDSSYTINVAMPIT